MRKARQRCQAFSALATRRVILDGDGGFLVGRLICKIVTGGVGAELGYALRKFGSERALEVVVVGRDACADRCSPMIAPIPCFHKGRGKISVLPVRDDAFAYASGLKPILKPFHR